MDLGARNPDLTKMLQAAYNVKKKGRGSVLPDFQPAYWANKFRLPDWYCQLEHELTSFVFSVVHDDPDLKAWRHRVYSLAGEMLERDEIPLASSGPDHTPALSHTRSPVAPTCSTRGLVRGCDDHAVTVAACRSNTRCCWSVRPIHKKIGKWNQP